VKKAFLDSDIILDALLERSGFDVPAMNILNLAYQGQLKIATSVVVLVNVNYFLEKYDRANRADLLKRLRSVISIIEIGERIIDLALESDFLDFEDAVQFYAAKTAKADVIITRNIKDHKQSTIPVLTAAQFLKAL
jgi:predicted nucleic acid-binding protein